MDGLLIEKRAFPRVAISLPVDILEEGISGKTLDMCETGLSFSVNKSLSNKVYSVNIGLPSNSFKERIEIIWRMPLAEKDKFLYGARFVELEKTSLLAIQETLFKRQIKQLLDMVEDRETKKRILDFFLGDFKRYIEDLNIIREEILTRDTYDPRFEEKVAVLNNSILLKANSLEKAINKKMIVKKVKENFRFWVSTFAYKSQIVKWAYEKPRGYPGDYRMLETIYNNQPLSEIGIGRCFDRYFLNNPYAVAVRIRKDKLKGMLRDFIETSNASIIKILNLACGSSREIVELLPFLNCKATIVFNCIDWDEEALDFSRKALQNVPQNVTFNFFKEDILELIKDEKYIERFGKQDLIYSIGLIDYFPDRILKKWLRFFYQLLPKGGKFIVTHKNREKTFPPLPPDWFCDWKFIPRNKQEVIDLLNNCGIKDFSLEIDVDDFNYIFYFTLTRD